jgi:hypothetical protein
LQACLNEEERRTCRGTNDTRSGTGKNVDTKGLDLRVTINGIGDGGSDRLVESQTATVEQDLVDVLNATDISICPEKSSPDNN